MTRNPTEPSWPGPLGAELPETLVPLRQADGIVPLVCVPAASGSPYSYGRLASVLRHQSVYGLEAPGLQDGRQPVSSISGLAADYEDVLRRAGLGDRVHLLGWSMGAIIAYELARLAASNGARIGALLLIDPPPPEPTDLPAEADVVRRFIQDLVGLDGMPAPLEAIGGAGIGGAGDGATEPAELLTAFQEAGVIPAELEIELLSERYAVFRSSVYALMRYEPRGSYPGEATLVRAAATQAADAPWRLLVGELNEHTISGNHYSVIHGDQLAALETIINDSIGRAG